MNEIAAIYARVSSDHQKEQNTIASQTAALLEYALEHQYTVPPEWVFEDEGYSGSVLVRPGLERLRDLIAEGAIQTVLVHGPDRLSRNYAYQVLLLEEFARQGAKVVFLKAPAADTPEQRLLLQLQGMIAEYERTQIVERCRRGKRHQAKAGVVNVLSSTAPYGYRYVKKTESAQAYYEVVESEAEVVRRVFSFYTVEGQSIRAIVRELNAQNIPTRSKKAPWIHATVWGMLKNRAYWGRACFGKTQPGPPSRLRVNRLGRLKGDYIGRSQVKRQRPLAEWIEIPVPALVSQETFELAQERLKQNQELSARHTKEPSVLQGLLVCAQCGYALYRVSTRGWRGRTRYRYYRCLGSDRYRPRGRVCNARPVRVDQLDQLVWEQVWQLNQPELIEHEIKRRLEEHRQSSPVEQRQQKVSCELARTEQQTDKLIDAYQEGLLDLSELRRRVPELKQRELTLAKELESLNLQSREHNRLVDLNVSMQQFVKQLRNSAQKLDIQQKQKIVRLLIREVVVGPDTITICHSIPLSDHRGGQKMPVYRLCMGRRYG